MIIVDSALQERQREGRPVRVGMVGAGFMGRGVAAQISRTPGMELVAVSNRHLSGAERAYRDAGAAECAPSTAPVPWTRRRRTACPR
jgi:predicted homoserine dehydrogenase-like protein